MYIYIYFVHCTQYHSYTLTQYHSKIQVKKYALSCKYVQKYGFCIDLMYIICIIYIFIIYLQVNMCNI